MRTLLHTLFPALLAATIVCQPAVAQTPPEPAADQTAVAPAADIICTPIEGKKPDEMVGPIVMGKMKIPAILDLLREYSGRVILPGEALPGTEVNFNSGGKLTRLNAIFALENLLALNGVALRLLDNGFVRAISSTNPDKSAPPMIEDIPVGANSEQIYTKLFKLEYFDSRTALIRVRGLLSNRNRSSIETLDEDNSLLVTDSLANLRRIQEVLELLDQPPQTRFEFYTFSIKYGSAWNIRSLLYQVFRSEMNNRLRQSIVHVDSRTNKLIVITHPSNYDFFANLVDELDQEVAPFTTTAVIKIEQGNYWSIWSTLRGIVSHQQRQFSRKGFVSPEERESEPFGSTRINSGGESGAAGTEGSEIADPEVAPIETAPPGADPGAVMVEEGPPELQFSPYIGLYADPSNNAFVVYGTNSDIERVRALLKQLDVKSPPYIDTRVFSIEFARASDLRGVIEYMIALQRRNFARQGITSGEAGGDEAAVSETSQEGFEYSNFVATIPDNRNNTILAQGTRRDIAQIETLIEKLDVKSAPLTSNEVIYLRHAEAQTLARVVQNIINYQRVMFARNRTQSQSEGQGSAVAPEMGFEFSDYAVVNADRRTNALYVYGTDRDITRVQTIVEKSDIPVEPMTTTQVFPLIHTDVTQTASLISRVISGQERSLRQVRSESREVSNPAGRTGEETAPQPGGVVEGNEALQFSAFVSVTPDRRSNSLIVYGTNSDIRQIETLLKQIDIEVAPLTQSKVFLLENTQARSLYGVLNNVVRGQERALRQVRSTIREIRNLHGEDPEAANAEVTLESLQFSPYVTITPNDRNNSIIVYGTDSDIEQLTSLIEVSDVEIAPKTQSRTFFIRHADANEIASTITNLIRQQQRVRERESTLTRIFRRNDNNQLDNGDEAGMSLETFADSAPSSDSGLITESSTQVYSDLFSFDEDLQFSPYVSLVADDRSNAVLAYGTQFDLDQISQLIDQIDDVLPQVRIEVVIAEVILNKDQVSGLESFGLSYNLDGANETNINTSAPRLNSSTSDPAFDMGLSLNNFSLNSIFRVAKQDRNVKVLSAPSITTTHNKQATINVGEARPIITSSASNLNNSDLVTRSTVEYRDIGITLRVRPLVSNQGFIQMELEQIVETVIGTQTIDNNEQPIIGTRRASSFLSVRDKEVIVLGGLQQVDSRETEGKVFILGDIPILGRLFRPKTTEQIVRELVIFIKPYIVESFEESELLTREELDRTAVGEDISYYLEEGRFREQEQLSQEIKKDETEDEPTESAEGNAPKPPVPEPTIHMTPNPDESSSTKPRFFNNTGPRR